MKIFSKRILGILVLSIIGITSYSYANGDWSERRFADYQDEIHLRFFDRLPSGVKYFSEWSYSGRDQRDEVEKCLEKSFEEFQQLQIHLSQNSESSNEGSDDFFKTYLGTCENINPKLNFLIKKRNLENDFFEIVFFQGKMLNKGGFKYIYPGVKVLFRKDHKIDYQHVVVASFIRPSEYYYYKGKEVKLFNRLGRPLNVVERYGFYDVAGDDNYLSQRRYLSWDDLKKRYLLQMSTEEKKAIINDMLKGIEQIHQRNLVHGDIKEDNLFFYYDRKEKRYAALIGDLDGVSPVGSHGGIYTYVYLSNENFVRHSRGHSIQLTVRDDFFAASMVAEAIMKGHSSVYYKRFSDMKWSNPVRYVKVKNHNSKCQKVKLKEIGDKEMVELINKLRCHPI